MTDLPNGASSSPESVPGGSLPSYAGLVPAPFQASRRDGIFALVAFVLGYFFCRWVLVSTQGWGTAVFTVAFLATVTTYLFAKGARMSGEAWFWFGVTLLVGLSFAVWDDVGLLPLKNMFLFCAAVYWVMAATQTQMAGRTNNFLLLDALSVVFIVPFSNFINQYRSLGALSRGREPKKRMGQSIALGIVLSAVVILFVTPQLLTADSGGFSHLLRRFIGLFRFDFSKLVEFLLYAFLAIPTAAYLFGLVSGCAARRHTSSFSPEKTGESVKACRVVAPVTIFIVLGAAVLLYGVFIACQVPYFFSAFSGARPEGWLSYSDYARRGFFELCRLAFVNLLLLTAANVTSRTPRRESLPLKIFNILLALITLLLIATAWSKMALYISAYGLTMLRILPCVFMALLAMICIGILVLQKWQFSIVRLALIAGAVLFTALCILNVDGYITRYNTNRYLAGTLPQYSDAVLYRAGAAGVPDAARVYETTEDPVLRGALQNYLQEQKSRTDMTEGTFWETYQDKIARERLRTLYLG
ncbi:DUF4173 domain-containing protein [Oscillospiraceae bacterium CM]|nr:DUF4173 domain-containing protein [Oscillospiraceae bacterium CM]